jgi:hypothetical protein
MVWSIITGSVGGARGQTNVHNLTCHTERYGYGVQKKLFASHIQRTVFACFYIKLFASCICISLYILILNPPSYNNISAFLTITACSEFFFHGVPQSPPSAQSCGPACLPASASCGAHPTEPELPAPATPLTLSLSALEAPSSKTLAMQKQTGKSGGSGGGTPAKRGRPFGNTNIPGAVTAAAAVGDPGAPATLVGPSLQVLLALSGNMFVSLFLQFR